MATKSILKNITVRKNATCLALVSALTNAKGKKSKDVSITRSVSTASSEEIDKMFSKYRTKKEN